MRHRSIFSLALLVSTIAAVPPTASTAEPPPLVVDTVAEARPADVPHQVFFIERTDSVRVSLRRFSASAVAPCPAASGWCHDASVVIADSASRADWPDSLGDHPDRIAHDDGRWPTACERCGTPFSSADDWQLRTDSLYRGAPDGRLYTLHDAPIGAMWDAHWMRHGDENRYRGPDGLSLVVKTPGGDWMVDGRASNCTLPSDDEHRCWVRHGDVRTGTVHVDKNGRTCAAGAGSILIGKYHGFLHNGYLTDG